MLEKKIFLEILKDFKHIIEVKKSDSSTLHDKEIAWNEICKQYNEASMISQERTLQQLKKLWTNLKQTQRELLTKEKQARMATGGGPPPPEINIDPDIATIAPHLMTTAPVIFTSNMTESEIDEKSEDIFNILQNDTEKDNNVILIDEINDEEQKGERITEKTVDKENQKIDFLNKVSSSKRTSLDNIYSQTTKPVKIRKYTSENLDNDENVVKIERIKRVMEEDEKEIANLRKAHENRMVTMKENFQKELYALDIRAATAKAKLAELQLQKEEEKYMRL